MTILLRTALAPWRTCFAGVLMAMSVAAGCNRAPTRAPSKEMPVTGKITLDGGPLADAQVQFTTQTFGSFISATDSDGVYKLLSTVGGEQTCEGPCQVTISKFVLPEGVTPEPDVSPMMQGGEQLLPRKYWDLDLTELQADVPAEGGSFDFHLTSK